MKQKCLAILCLSFASAAGAWGQITLNAVASKALGQPQLIPKTAAPNLVEGREFWGPQGVALDTSVSPPVLYVSDTFNNRVMVWKNATGFTNGQPADVILGQIDQYSTTPGGGSNNSTGLYLPSGLAVSGGNLYVADTGNNRILRFPKPYTQTTGNIFPDMWIGQPTVSSSSRNYTGSLGATGLNLFGATVNLAFDPAGGLWLTDSGNNRVLHYPASSLTCTNCGAITADIVLGQPNMTTATTSATQLSNSDPNAAVIANEFNLPGALAIDPAGNVYVSDSGAGGFNGRILVFAPPFINGAGAQRIMGITAPGVPFVNQTAIDATVFAAPNGIFFFPNDGAIGVLDTGFNRILIFPPYNSWKGTTTPTSPQAISYYGQPTYLTTGPNQSTSGTVITPQASNATLWHPASVAVNAASNEIYLADATNNRVLALPFGNDSLSPATRVLGQDFMTSGSPNLIEGREFYFTASASTGTVADAGIAIDTSGSTPHLYVADPYNNRILGFKDLRTVQPGARADIVIGQPNFTTALCNYSAGSPGNGGDAAAPNQNSLCQPKGIAVDAQGNLYVADSANGRVLRFPAPFSYQGTLEPADLVLGQPSFTAQFLNPSPSTMSSPYGLAFTGTNGLLVSDQAFHRVLFFKYPSGNSFAAGTPNLAATKVFGQPNFTTITAGTTTDKMNSPHHIACDSNGQLYVADTGNNRILVFQDPNNPQTPSTGYAAGTTLGGFSQPEGIYVNPTTGEIWVANTNAATAQRYPAYSTLLFNPTQLGRSIADYGQTLALAQDSFGDLVVADATNRISVYFPAMTGLNGANFEVSKPQLSPQLIASLFPIDSTVTFGKLTGVYTDVNSNGVWPTTLDDVQVLFNGTPAPIDFVSPGQINFLVPNGAPVTGTVDVEVVQKSTSQVYAAGELPMTTVAPGMFLCPGGQTSSLRQACIINQDGTVNTQTNAAPRGSTIEIFVTGLGYLPNAPADGQPAPNGPTPGTTSLDVVFSGIASSNEVRQPNDPPAGTKFVSYIGLAPGFVGLWQINVTIPFGVPIGTQIPINLLVNGNVGEPDLNAGYRATVAVK